MNFDVYSGKVNVQKHFQFGQPEVSWTVGVGNSHRLPDFAILETPQLAVWFIPEGVKLVYLKYIY